MSEHRESTGCRFDSANAASVSGLSDTAAAIAAQPKWRALCRDDSSFAAAGTTWRALNIPRVVRSTVERIVAFVEHPQLRDVSFAEYDRTHAAQLLYQRCVLARCCVGQSGQARSRRRARDVKHLLNRDWQSMERPQDLPSRLHLVSGPSGF